MGSAPKAPPPPTPSSEELRLMRKQGKSIDAYINSLKEQREENKALGLLTQVSSGLYDPVYDSSGNLIDATINQGAVDNLRADFAKNREIGLLQSDRLEKALKGELPISAGTMERKAKEFSLLKESAARRGINIQGDSVDNATSDSTSGNEILGQFKRTYGLLEDAERRGEIANVSGVSLGGQTLGIASGASAYGPMATGAGYGQASGLLGSAMQPFQFNRQLQYQADQQNAINRAQLRSDYAGLLGTAAGTGIGTFAALSSAKFKEDIRDLSEKEEADFLDSLLRVGLKRYRYKGDQMERVGYITEEAPKTVVTLDGEHLDIVSYFGYLTGAVREMARRIKELEAKNG